MLTGTVPFKGDSAVTVAMKHVNELAPEPAELVPGMPYALNQIVMKALAKDPGPALPDGGGLRPRPARRADGRAGHRGDVRPRGGPDAGHGTADGRDTGDGAPGWRRRPGRRRSRRALWIVLLLLAVIAAAAAGISGP